MGEYRLTKIKAGRGSYARVEVTATKQDGPSRVLEALPEEVRRGTGRSDWGVEPTWVQAAVQGASEALAAAERSGRLTDHFLVAVTGVAGNLADTTEDAV